MSVTDENNKHVYDGNGTTIHWAYTFPIINSSDIKVYITDINGESTLLTTSYYVDVVDREVDYPTVASGLDPLASGYQITLIREMDLTQTTNLRNQGAYSATTFETAFDRLTMMAQQLQEQIDRCLKLGVNISPTQAEVDAYTTALMTMIRRYEQDTDPAGDPSNTVSNGDLWLDTSTGQANVRVSGSWRTYA